MGCYGLKRCTDQRLTGVSQYCEGKGCVLLKLRRTGLNGHVYLYRYLNEDVAICRSGGV